jgi:hypothetical protein
MHKIEIFIGLLCLALVLKAGHVNLKELWSKIFGSPTKIFISHFDNIILTYPAALFTSCQLVPQSYVTQILTYENFVKLVKCFHNMFRPTWSSSDVNRSGRGNCCFCVDASFFLWFFRCALCIPSHFVLPLELICVSIPFNDKHSDQNKIEMTKLRMLWEPRLCFFRIVMCKDLLFILPYINNCLLSVGAANLEFLINKPR